MFESIVEDSRPGGSLPTPVVVQGISGILVPRQLLSSSLAALAVALTVALLGATPALADQCAEANLIPTSSNAPQINAAMLCLLNRQRSEHGLGALSDSRTLDQVALQHTRDMVTNGYFAHSSPVFGDLIHRLTAAGYISRSTSYSVGENIGWGIGGLAAPDEVVNAWMSSPDHRANVLNGSYTDVGLAVVSGVPFLNTGGRPAATYTGDFGERSGPVAAPAKSRHKRRSAAKHHRRARHAHRVRHG